MDNRLDNKKKKEMSIEETEPLTRVWNIESREGVKDTKDN